WPQLGDFLDGTRLCRRGHLSTDRGAGVRAARCPPHAGRPPSGCYLQRQWLVRKCAAAAVVVGGVKSARTHRAAKDDSGVASQTRRTLRLLVQLRSLWLTGFPYIR